MPAAGRPPPHLLMQLMWMRTGENTPKRKFSNFSIEVSNLVKCGGGNRFQLRFNPNPKPAKSSFDWTGRTDNEFIHRSIA